MALSIKIKNNLFPYYNRKYYDTTDNLIILLEIFVNSAVVPTDNTRTYRVGQKSPYKSAVIIK